MTHRFVLATLAVMLSAGCASAADQGTSIDVSVRRMPFEINDADNTVAGRLRFRGGLALSSSNENFGGMSGLIVSADGSNFLSMSDRGYWIRGQLQYEGNQLHGVSGVSLGVMRDEDGSPLIDKVDADAEGLTAFSAEGPAGDVFVSFEQRHRIERYPFGRDGFDAIPTPVETPQGVKNGPGNGGLEAIVRLDEDRILAISEDMRDAKDNIRAWLVPLTKSKVERLSIKRVDPYAITDIVQLPSGDFMTLERRFTQWGGVGMQMRLIKRADIVAGGTFDGEIVADLGMTYAIDNMEGMSARRGENGETLLYVVSDDNFNRPIQQTLLLMFELIEPATDGQ